MESKKFSLLSGFAVSPLMCLIVAVSSFCQLISRPRDRVQNPSGGALYCRTALMDMLEEEKAARVKDEYNELFYINKKFNDFSNALFRYDARIASAYKEFDRWQACLQRRGDCAGLDMNEVKEKQDDFSKKIHKLNADKNRIMTMQSALKKYWYALIPVIAAGGAAAFAANGQWNKEEVGQEPSGQGDGGGQLAAATTTGERKRSWLGLGAKKLEQKEPAPTAEELEAKAQREQRIQELQEELKKVALTPEELSRRRQLSKKGNNDMTKKEKEELRRYTALTTKRLAIESELEK